MSTSALRKHRHCLQKVSGSLKKSILFLLCISGIIPLSLVAQGDLLITPRRVVFEGNRQRQEITLANTGQDTARYSISFVQYRMSEEGTFEQIESPDPGQMFADPFLRYFPRTVTLAPQESQVVRMQLRRLPGMEDGEYRSHMYFRAVPDERPLGEEDILADTAAIGIRLTPIFGITIPVIIRVGDVSATVSLNDLKLVKEEGMPPALNIVFKREGNQSVFGDITVEYIPLQGEKVEVGVVRGIAVYTPNTKRRFTLQLRNTENLDLTKGSLLVRYNSASEARPELLAEKELRLN